MFLIVVLCILIINIIAVPFSYGLSNPGGMVTDADDFIGIGNKGSTVINKGDIKAVSDSIYNILLIIATVLAVGIISILGIKYMIGSAEGKAEVKDSLIPFIVGCIVVFGSFTIWKVVILMTNNL